VDISKQTVFASIHSEQFKYSTRKVNDSHCLKSRCGKDLIETQALYLHLKCNKRRRMKYKEIKKKEITRCRIPTAHHGGGPKVLFI